MAKDSDKLTAANQIEQLERVVKQMTNQLKQIKQDSHFQQLKLNKQEVEMQEMKMLTDKMAKENMFLNNRI